MQTIPEDNGFSGEHSDFQGTCQEERPETIADGVVVTSTGGLILTSSRSSGGKTLSNSRSFGGNAGSSSISQEERLSSTVACTAAIKEMPILPVSGVVLIEGIVEDTLGDSDIESDKEGDLSTVNPEKVGSIGEVPVNPTLCTQMLVTDGQSSQDEPITTQPQTPFGPTPSPPQTTTPPRQAHIYIPSPNPEQHMPTTVPTSLSSPKITLPHLSKSPNQTIHNPCPSSSLSPIHAQTQTLLTNLPPTQPETSKSIGPQKQLETSNRTPRIASDDSFDWSSESSDDSELEIPPGFTPTREEMFDIRSLMKEGISMIPKEHQRDFLESVDKAEDGEILAFFKEKFKDRKPASVDTNYLTHHNLRRSPRLKKKSARLEDSNNSSGLKKGFLK